MFGFLKKVTGKITSSAKSLFRIVIPARIDAKAIKSIEDSLYSADFGVEITTEIVEEIKQMLKSNNELRGENVINVASKILKDALCGSEASLNEEKKEPQVICLVGTNGSGKTTTAAKLANYYTKHGKSVILGACDTFRAAANEQINSWADRLSVDIVSSRHGADSAAVAFDAYKAAVARGKDIIILDTAGRLHTKTNLMSELQKIFRVLKKADENIIPHVWLVADSTIGTNTIESAKIFNDALGVTGMIMTKLDGTSAGGVLVGVYKKLNIPIYFICKGETPDSIEKFSIETYIDSLFKSED